MPVRTSEVSDSVGSFIHASVLPFSESTTGDSASAQGIGSVSALFCSSAQPASGSMQLVLRCMLERVLLGESDKVRERRTSCELVQISPSVFHKQSWWRKSRQIHSLG